MATVVVRLARKLGWPEVPHEVWYSVEQLSPGAAGSIPSKGEAAWRHVCKVAPEAELFYAERWLNGLMNDGDDAVPRHKLSLVGRIKRMIEMSNEISNKMARRGLRTLRSLKIEFIWKALPRDPRRPGVTPDDLHARWSRAYGPRPSRGVLRDDLEFMHGNGMVVRKGKGTPGDPYRYRGYSHRPR